MILRKAWGDLRTRKLRTAMVVLSVAVAAFGVSSIKILGDQLERSAAERYGTSNPPDLTVDTMPLTTTARDALRDVYNIQTVETRVVGTARWTPPGSDRSENLAIQGVAEFRSANTLDSVRVVRGAAPGPGEALFERDARQKYGLTIGQQVTLIGTDGERVFTVSGFGENPNVVSAAVLGYASAWLPHDDAERLLKLGGDTRVLIRMKDDGTAALREYTQQQVRDSLEGDEVTVLASRVRDPATMPGLDVIDALHTMLLTFGLLGAVASSLLVVNIISTVVLEQRPQIGAMKAIGGTTRAVMAAYLALALLYGALGTAIGLVAGIGLAVLTTNARASALDEPPSALTLTPEAITLVVGIGVGSCLLAALVPAWLGARITIREALVSYGITANFGRGIWGRLVVHLRGLPPAAMLAVRNTFRQPQRALFTLLGLAVVTAVLLAVLAALNSLSYSLQAAGAALKADLVLGFDTLAEDAAVNRALADAPGIDRRELWLVSSAKLAGKTVTVTGLPPDTSIFDTSTVRSGGSWLAAGATDQAVVTERLAARQQVGVGSEIELTSGTHPARRWKIVGIVAGAGPDAMAPDGVVYAPYEAVRTLLDFPEGHGNQLYVRLAERGRARIDEQARALTDALANAGLSNTPVKLYEQQESTQRIFAGFVLLFSLMVLIVSVVGALGLFGTLTMNVLERRREIGVIRSIGGPTRTLLLAFLLEALVLGLLGWGLGVALGAPASRLFVGFFSDRLIPLEYVFPGVGMLASALAVLGVTLAASLGPALLAARIRIADILRYS